MKADLHMHSIYSDGTKTPQELVLMAKERNLTHIALTDHDSVRGVDELIEHANKYNIKVIKGLELSTYSLGESVHLLAYFENEFPQKLIDFSINQAENRRNRAKKMATNVIEMFNLKMNIDRLLEFKGIITRVHICDELLLSNPGITREEAFRLYLGNDSKALVPASKMSTKEGIKFLREINATIILAHPVLLKKNDVEDIIKLGVDGLEGLYPNNTEEDNIKFMDLAKKYNLMITAGSDYHGVENDSHADMGTVYLEDNLFRRF